MSTGPVGARPTMRRLAAMATLAQLLTDELVVLSLGGSVDEWYTAAPHLREASLFQQQLGCVTPQAFGLAVGLPHRRVVALDTDGGLLFNLGVLATLANEQPPNLLVVVWDNECYQSIGGPRTHTAAGRVDLAAIARGAGIAAAHTVRDVEAFAAHCAAGLAAAEPYVVVAKVDTSPLGDGAPGTPAPGTPAPGTPAPGTPAPGTPAPGTPAPGTPDSGSVAAETVHRKHSDGREDTYRFVRHVEATEGIVIMGPSEHN